jgi:hypothetical protein
MVSIYRDSVFLAWISAFARVNKIARPPIVMTGPHPAIQQHIEGALFFMDGRIKRGHDG